MHALARSLYHDCNSTLSGHPSTLCLSFLPRFPCAGSCSSYPMQNAHNLLTFLLSHPSHFSVCHTHTYDFSLVFSCLQVEKAALFRTIGCHPLVCSVSQRQPMGADLSACKFPPNLWRSWVVHTVFTACCCFMLASFLANSSTLADIH